MFFKGVLLADPDVLLTSQGAETQSALSLRFTDLAQVTTQAGAIRAQIASAVAVEARGETEVRKAMADRDLPPELLDTMLLFDLPPLWRALGVLSP